MILAKTVLTRIVYAEDHLSFQCSKTNLLRDQEWKFDSDPILHNKKSAKTTQLRFLPEYSILAANHLTFYKKLL
jgi:hypothetical protein